MLLRDELGGGGRAKGFVGPVAPALKRALALGEGGGSTTPEPDDGAPSVAPALVDPVPPEVPDFLGEEPPVSPVVLPPSECSLGI